MPDTLYLNVEQKHRGASDRNLSQQGIDTAFRRPETVSSNRNTYAGTTIIITNGKNTDDLRVIHREHPRFGPLRMTDLARTLVDIAVRPVCSGGTKAVLGAYQRAASQVSIQDLADIVDDLGHIYPYHQAIGFYLERTEAFPQEELKLLQDMGLKYEFYLDRAIENRNFSNSWKLWYPAEWDLPVH